MFDAHKLDISDELRTVLDQLRPHQDKIRVLLNKADTIDPQALLRVYGALMWSLGKVVKTPEVCRVYMGSFWDNPPKLAENRALLEKEKYDLLTEIMALPQNAVVRRINELVKRARSVKVHAYIIHYLKKQMPYMVGKSEKQKRLLDRLDKEFLACARRYNLPLGDFPNVDKYRKMLSEIKDISDFKRLDKNLVYEMDKVLTVDIPLLLRKATPQQVQQQQQLQQPQQAYDYRYQGQRQQQQQHQHARQQYGRQQEQQPYDPRNGPPPNNNYPQQW
jgi:EH domain-containing protein 1